MTENISVREIREEDIESISNYFLDAEDSFLINMGVDLLKLPSKDEWIKMLSEQLTQSYEDKKSYCIIWQVHNKPIGHSNVNKIIFGKEAYMHLHIWNNEIRRKGMGTELVKKTLPYFFKNAQLKKLFCEPNAFNTAPNRILEKVGFRFVKNHITTPGWLNFEQPCNLWELSLERFKKINK